MMSREEWWKKSKQSDFGLSNKSHRRLGLNHRDIDEIRDLAISILFYRYDRSCSLQQSTGSTCANAHINDNVTTFFISHLNSH
jgi:hypothetical protein